MEKFIMADGCALRVRESGQGGPALLLLHGYLESIDVWDEFIPLLEGVHVVAPDLPGHGISEVKGPVHTMEFLARTVKGALDTLGIRTCYVAGHSMGGYVALELLRLFPETVQGIVLMHSTPDADTPGRKEAREREIALVEAGKKELIARINPAGSFAPENRRRMRDEIEGLSELVFLTEDAGILALLRGMEARRDNNDTLTASHVPQLFIFGRGDGFIPVEAAESIIARHPQAQAVWLEHSGHMGYLEEPQAVVDAITAFLAAAK